MSCIRWIRVNGFLIEEFEAPDGIYLVYVDKRYFKGEYLAAIQMCGATTKEKSQ